DWITDAAADLIAQGKTVAADDGGPNRVVIDALARRGLPVQTLTGRDAATAWVAFKAKAKAKALRHDASDALRTALEVAAEKRVGDSVMLSRRDSLGPIDPANAAMTAAWFADRHTTAIPFG